MRGFCLALLLTASAPLLAQETPSALTADEVMAASAVHFPSILASLADRRAAEGRALEAEGAFDLVFSADGFNRASGFYDGATVVTGKAERRLRSMGASVYTGYRLSDGEFPIYEDVYFTNSGGELTIGVLFSLLRDREIDSQRFGVSDAALALREADQELMLVRIGVQRRALIAYWKWVTEGRKLGVYTDLVRIAEDREEGLEQQVRRGARAEIFLTENLQNLTRRRTLAAAAERDFRRAANELSYYYRDANGQPRLPGANRLPPLPDPEAVAQSPALPEGSVSDALLRRPELLKIRATIERVRNRILLAENDLKPKLDFSLGVDHDFGGVAEGGPSRDGTDTKVGLTFSIPLERRQARGRIATAEAQLDALRQRQRRTQDEIEIEVRNILINLDVANELLRLAVDQVSQAERMRDAERRRFDSGASDFFLVNLREETAANARILYHQARLEREKAIADYSAATVDIERLNVSF